MAFHVVIPARHASTRLPGKPLLDIGGPADDAARGRARCASGAAQVLVATDDARIAAAVTDPRAPGSSNRGDDRSGTSVRHGSRRGRRGRARLERRHDRRQRAGRRAVHAAGADRPGRGAARARSRPPASQRLRRRSSRSSNSWTRTSSRSCTATGGAALYFSRAPIPWTRDGAPAGLASQREFGDALRHVGIYAYRVGALRRITSLAPSSLELREKLEQLGPCRTGSGSRWKPVSSRRVPASTRSRISNMPGPVRRAAPAAQETSQ